MRRVKCSTDKAVIVVTTAAAAPAAKSDCAFRVA